MLPSRLKGLWSDCACSALAGELNERTELGRCCNLECEVASLSLCRRKRPKFRMPLLLCGVVGDVAPSWPIELSAECGQLGVGLFGLCDRLRLDALPRAVLMEVGALSFCRRFVPESSLLVDGRSGFGSS